MDSIELSESAAMALKLLVEHIGTNEDEIIILALEEKLKELRSQLLSRESL